MLCFPDIFQKDNSFFENGSSSSCVFPVCVLKGRRDHRNLRKKKVTFKKNTIGLMKKV